MEVSDLDMPDDVRLMHHSLRLLALPPSALPLSLDLANDGTAMRFLTAYAALQEGRVVRLDGCTRMRERPIAQLVDALRSAGADIRYLAREGYPPLEIHGRSLTVPALSVSISHPLSTQFVSALLLLGWPVQTDSTSPYIRLTRACVRNYRPDFSIEPCWSSAAFWYEWVAIHGGELLLADLRRDSLQGDSIVADAFACLGVETCFVEGGALIRRSPIADLPHSLSWNFADCPDLYPALAMACHCLGVHLLSTGTESLPLKESNRLSAVEALCHADRAQVVSVSHDHRIAMAAMVAGYRVDDTECVAKSYPSFCRQLWSIL